MAVMTAFQDFKLRLLVSTDVMARGVDLDRVNLVVNLDLPPDAATYVHRVGRTGRFGSRGIAVAFVDGDELKVLQGYLKEVSGGKGDGWGGRLGKGGGRGEEVSGGKGGDSWGGRGGGGLGRGGEDKRSQEVRGRGRDGLVEGEKRRS